MSMLADRVDVVIGVDTHKFTHTAAVVVARTGAAIADRTVATDPDGYLELFELAQAHGDSRAWAIESTGGYGAGLTDFLVEAGELVIELDRPERPRRRGGAKSDQIDAIRAARDAMSREHLGQPRARGQRAALSALLAARRWAVEGSSAAQHQFHALIVTSPEVIRSRFRAKTKALAIEAATRLRIDPGWNVETRTAASVLRGLARRIRGLNAEAQGLERSILEIVRSWRPDLLDQLGVGPVVAAVVLCAWSHPGRCRNEGAFARLGGVAPIPASSGVTNRHRINPYGDRQLNRALHTVVICRLRYDPSTRDYAEARTKEGKTGREIRRCLKRYVARQLFRRLEHPPVA